MHSHAHCGIGVAFFNENGERPAECSAWQFNFKFNLAKDTFAQDSIDLLKRSGIQFALHEKARAAFLPMLRSSAAGWD